MSVSSQTTQIKRFEAITLANSQTILTTQSGVKTCLSLITTPVTSHQLKFLKGLARLL